MQDQRNITNPSSEKDFEDLISRAALQYTGLVFKMFLNPVLAVGGVSSNLISMAVFFRMGLKEGTTQSFVILSVSDGLAALACISNCICYTLKHTIYRRTTGDANRGIYIAYYVTVISIPFFLNFSTLITTVISVVRCCCVVMPLRVKQFLTTGRQLTTIVLLSCIILSVQVYAISPGRFVSLYDPQKNSSRVLIIGVNAVLLDAFRNTFCYLTFFIVILCVIILTVALRHAAKFHSRAANKGSATDDSKRQSNSREIQVVKTVILIAFVFIISNIPTALVAVLRLNLEGFSNNGRYRNFYECYLTITETFCMLNINANIFVYFFFNRLYRNSFCTIFNLQLSQKCKEKL